MNNKNANIIMQLLSTCQVSRTCSCMLADLELVNNKGHCSGGRQTMQSCNDRQRFLKSLISLHHRLLFQQSSILYALLVVLFHDSSNWYSTNLRKLHRYSLSLHSCACVASKHLSCHDRFSDNSLYNCSVKNVLKVIHRLTLCRFRVTLVSIWYNYVLELTPIYGEKYKDIAITFGGYQPYG